jgi:5-methyltetrahydrofolate--homocysteine methyltransferase
MSTFLSRLASGETLVADGATGTNLQKLGLKPGTIPEELLFDDPDVIFNLEKSFVEAGSDIILTCTFGGTRVRLKESKYADKVTEINARAVEVARKAASLRPGVLVGGSIGPTGALLKPLGPLTAEEAAAAFHEQASALASAGVDLFVVETQFALDEAKLAVEAVKAVSDLPIVISFSYDRGTRTMMGVKPAQIPQTFAGMGVAAIGANCGTTLENMEILVNEYAATQSGLPIWAKPNAGLPRLNTDTNLSEYDVTPEQMADFAQKYVAAGARIVGGCCGSTPEHIAAIAKAVK